MTPITELEAMRLDILERGTHNHDQLVAFASRLHLLLVGEGFKATYPAGSDWTEVIVQSATDTMGIKVSHRCDSLMYAYGYVDCSTVQQLVDSLHKVCREQEGVAYCQQCDYFHEDYEEDECITCLLDLEMKAGCPQRRIKGT